MWLKILLIVGSPRKHLLRFVTIATKCLNERRSHAAQTDEPAGVGTFLCRMIMFVFVIDKNVPVNGRRDYAISAPEVHDRAHTWARRPFLYGCLSRQKLWPGNDLFFRTALPAYDVCLDRVSRGRRRRRLNLCSVVYLEGTT